MEIKSEIEVSIVEHINSSNVDGAIDNKEVCKVEEDEIEELKFESNCNFEDKNEGEMDPDDNENQCEENLGIPGGEKHSNEDTFGVEDFKNEIKVEEIDTSDPKYKATRKRSMAHLLEESKQEIDLNDNRYYGRRLGRSTRAIKQINYNERTESDEEESIPGETKLSKGDDFFISEEIDNDGNKENSSQWTKVCVVLESSQYLVYIE